MARQEARWVHQVGDGLIYLGAGWIVALIVYFHAGGDWVIVYDGADVGSGRVMMHLVEFAQRTRWVTLGPGFRFERGIYLDMVDSDCHASVLWEPDL